MTPPYYPKVGKQPGLLGRAMASARSTPADRPSSRLRLLRNVPAVSTLLKPDWEPAFQSDHPAEGLRDSCNAGQDPSVRRTAVTSSRASIPAPPAPRTANACVDDGRHESASEAAHDRAVAPDILSQTAWWFLQRTPERFSSSDAAHGSSLVATSPRRDRENEITVSARSPWSGRSRYSRCPHSAT
jgi:hypothetical protein